MWVDGAKIAAVGVGVTRWHSFHGAALNVCPNMHDYSRIIPCGLVGRRVTSLWECVPQLAASGRPAASVMDEVRTRLVRHFEDVFNAQAVPTPFPADIDVSDDVQL